jgi:hypothetical protein
MSGMLSQLGVAKEKIAAFSVTAGAGTAGSPNIATLTKTAHGLRVGDVVVITASTVTGYNGTWTITAVPSSSTFVIQTGTVLLGAATATFPLVTPTAYAVVTTPVKFFEFNKESAKSERKRVETASLRLNNRVQASNRFAVYEGGVKGDVELEVLSNGFGYWLDAMMGAVATTGPTDSAYTHTATIGSVRGKSFTYQKLVPQSTGGTAVMTYLGMKVSSWEISCDVDGILMVKLSFMGRQEDLTVPLAVASYPASQELLTFVGGSVLVDTVAVGVVKKFALSCDLKLAERRFVGPSALQAEPLESAPREFKLTMDVEFSDMTLYNKYVSATAAGSLAAISATWTAPTLIGVTAKPYLTVTIPKFRVDGETPGIEGPDLLASNITGPCFNTDPATQDAVTLVYSSTDSTTA